MSFNKAAEKTCLYNNQETVTEKGSANLPCGTRSAGWGLSSSCPSCLAHMLQKQVSVNGACPHVPRVPGGIGLWTVGDRQPKRGCAESGHQDLTFIPPCFPLKVEGCHSKMILSWVFSLIREKDNVYSPSE